MPNYVGYQKFTADAVINTSGRPVAIWGIYVESGASGTAVVAIYDGTSASGTKVMSVTGTDDAGYIAPQFSKGYVLPNGGFVDIDSNTSFAIVWYETLS